MKTVAIIIVSLGLGAGVGFLAGCSTPQPEQAPVTEDAPAEGEDGTNVWKQIGSVLEQLEGTNRIEQVSGLMIGDLMVLQELNAGDAVKARVMLEERMLENVGKLLVEMKAAGRTDLANVPGLRGAARYYEERPVRLADAPEAEEFIAAKLEIVREQMRARREEREQRVE